MSDDLRDLLALADVIADWLTAQSSYVAAVEDRDGWAAEAALADLLAAERRLQDATGEARPLDAIADWIEALRDALAEGAREEA